MLNRKAPADFVCPLCRLERIDEFQPPFGTGVLCHRYVSCSSTVTFSLTFTAQALQWRNSQCEVHVRSVHLGSTEFGGPAWPHSVQGKLNGAQCVVINPPAHLHVRREQCYNIMPVVRQGMNTLELKFTPRSDKPREEPEDNYCVGVVLTRPRTVPAIIGRIRAQSTETVDSARQRIERLLSKVARQGRRDNDCQVTGDFGRKLRPLCPVSFCPIEDAAIGRNCKHIQVFDLEAYVSVNQKMSSLEKRWKCPVCSQPVRLDDVILDPFAQEVLDQVSGEEDIDAIVFNEDCTWSMVSTAKDEATNDGRVAPAGRGEDTMRGDQSPVQIDLD